MAWIELHQSLPSHKKTLRLRRALKITQPQAVGHLCMWWLWCIDNAPDADLSEVDNIDIAEAAGWTKNADAFVDALITAGFVDKDRQIHDWDAYAGKLIQKRKANAKRMRDARAREKNESTDDSAHADHVQRTCDAQTAHVRQMCEATVPNRTQQYPTKSNDDDGDDGARARDPFDPLPQTPEEAAERRVLLEFLPCGLGAATVPIEREIEDMIVLPDLGATPDERADVIIRAMREVAKAPGAKRGWSTVAGLIRHWQREGSVGKRAGDAKRFGDHGRRNGGDDGRDGGGFKPPNW